MLQPHGSSQNNLESIKFAALSCRQPLEEILGKIRKYERSLGVRSDRNVFTTTTNKLAWSFGKKDEIRKLQSYLNVHVGTINILLTEYGLEKIDIAADKADTKNVDIRDSLRLLPGTEITMAIIVERPPLPSIELCPMPRCRSTVTSPALGGGWTWLVDHSMALSC
jgi:hypothetical protein